MASIEIYDTTLRDGTQGLDFNLTAEDKVMIANRVQINHGWQIQLSFFFSSNRKSLIRFRSAGKEDQCERYCRNNQGIDPKVCESSIQKALLAKCR